MKAFNHIGNACVLGCCIAFATGELVRADETPTHLRIASVNNPDMFLMQELLDEEVQRDLGVVLSWQFFQESVLRKQLELDFRQGSSQFDIVAVGSYEAPLAGARGDLSAYPGTRPDSDYLPTIIDALSHEGEIYALPFYGESSITYYRADWMREAGLEMPDDPTWEDIEHLAEALHDAPASRFGLCLRGEPGWGINMALLNTMANTYGARWYNMEWHPQLDTDPWRRALSHYAALVGTYGPPDPASLGYTRLLSMFSEGQCAIWVDATVAASALPGELDVGYAPAPRGDTSQGRQWLWSWALAVPATSSNVGAAWGFVEWVTSAAYHELVAREKGIGRVPPGTLSSLYQDPNYLDQAPFAEMTLQAIQQADPNRATLLPVPYQGIQYVGIEEYGFIADLFGRKVLSVVEGTDSPANALREMQELAEAYMALRQRHPLGGGMDSANAP